MRTVYKAVTDKCVLGMENLGIYHVELISAIVVIAVADSALKVHFADTVVYECREYLVSVVLCGFADFCKLRRGKLFGFLCGFKQSAVNIEKFHFYPLVISYAVPVAVNPQFI